MQEGHSALLVQGKFNSDVARLYYTLQKHNSGSTTKISRLVWEGHYHIDSQVRSQNIRGRGTGSLGRQDYYRARGGGHNFFQSSEFYRDWQIIVFPMLSPVQTCVRCMISTNTKNIHSTCNSSSLNGCFYLLYFICRPIQLCIFR